jgi:oxygen-dependent protoporphyrinogen oxidase
MHVRTGTRVKDVRRSDGWTVDGEPFDAVVVALPVRAAAAVLSGVEGGPSPSLEEIPTASTATLNLVYRASEVDHPLPAFGFVVPAREGLSLMACTFTTRKYAGRAGPESVILRAFVGGALGVDAYARPDGALIDAARADLDRLLGLRATPTRTHLVRWPDRFPQLTIGHGDRVAAIRQAEAQLPGLAVAGNFFGGAGISDCIVAASRAVEKIRCDLTRV